MFEICDAIAPLGILEHNIWQEGIWDHNISNKDYGASFGTGSCHNDKHNCSAETTDVGP